MESTTSHITGLQNGRYKLVGELGAGGMATVYMGFDTMLKVRRAIKVLNRTHSQSEKIRTRFLQEAQTMARLRHANIVTVFDVGMDGETPFIVMELLEGGCFQDYVERMAGFSPPLAAKLMQGMLYGLQEAHDNGVVHRDIKPHNILLSMDGKPKLTDFGIAQVADTDHSMTKTGSVLGTLAYMAPEQRIDAKSADHTADIYASGATLYALVKATQPFDLYATEFHKKVFEGVPDNCAAIIKKACEFEQSERYQTPVEMAKALTPLKEALTDEDWDAFLGTIQTPKEQQGTMAWDPEDESVGDDISQTFHFGNKVEGKDEALLANSQDSLAAQPSEISNADLPDYVASEGKSRLPLIGGLVLLVALAGGAFVMMGGSEDTSGVPGGEEVEALQANTEIERDAALVEEPTADPEVLEADAEALVEEPTPESKPEPVVIPEPAVEAKPEPKPAPAPVVTPRPAAATPDEPAAKPKPEPVVEAKPEPKPAPAPVALDPVEAKINTLPPSVIFVDGVAKGPTPWLGETILPGTHSLRMKSNDGREATTTITVRPNQTFRFCWSFDTSGPCRR